MRLDPGQRRRGRELRRDPSRLGRCRAFRRAAGLVAVLLLGSCASRRSEREIADLLVVLPGAAELQHQAHAVLYRVAEAYPGTSTLEALDERLSRQGCRASAQDPLNAAPGLMRRTWSGIGGEGGGTRTAWMGAWTCDRGDVVVFTISVAAPGTHVGLPLGLAGGYYSADDVRMIRARTRATP